MACAFNSFSIAHGNSVTAYRDASVDYGTSCLSEQRLCSNGVLSGSNAYPSCRVNEASSCTFNGQTVSSGSSVTAYESNSVNFGSSCQTELRSCSNGTLSGSYTNAVCSVASAASCTFNGQAVAHGTSINAYQAASVAFGSTCTSQSRTCSNGTLSGSYTNSTCSVAGAQNCSFNGSTVNDGQSVTAYQAASVVYGNSCTSESRSCSNGSLSGSYSFGSCSVQSPATCSFNGQTIAHGASLTAYQVNSVAYGEECSSETRNCSNGTLGGTYSNSSCSVASAAGCSFGGQTVDHGSSVTAYLSDSVAYGQTCSTQTRSCSNGTLSGTYANSSCSVAAAASCSFNGQTVAHGSSVTAYQAASVAYGSSCTSESRDCENGLLHGSYAYSDCSVAEQPMWEGVKQIGTSSNDRSNDITTDTDGNVYITGYTEGGLGSNVYAGNTDLFVGKYNSSGIMQWIKQFGNSTKQGGNGITTDSDRNIYIVGYTHGELDGNTNYGEYDIFVMKYSHEGIKQWTRQFGTSRGDVAYDIAADTLNNIYVTGYTQYELDGNTFAGDWDLFVIKYNKDGTRQWTRQFGTTELDVGSRITTDSSGNIYVTGYTYGNFEGNINSGGIDVLIFKYNSSGVMQWAQQLGTEYFDNAYGISTDSIGNVYVTGYTSGNLDGNTSAGEADLFVVKYDSNGIKQWTRQIGTSTSDSGQGIALDPYDNIFVAGLTNSQFDGNANFGSQDLFLVKYDSSGLKQWSRQFGTPMRDSITNGVTTDKARNIFISGSTLGAFAGNTNNGSEDIFLIKYDGQGNPQ